MDLHETIEAARALELPVESAPQRVVRFLGCTGGTGLTPARLATLDGERVLAGGSSAAVKFDGAGCSSAPLAAMIRTRGRGLRLPDLTEDRWTRESALDDIQQVRARS